MSTPSDYPINPDIVAVYKQAHVQAIQSGNPNEICTTRDEYLKKVSEYNESFPDNPVTNPFMGIDSECRECGQKFKDSSEANIESCPDCLYKEYYNRL